MKLGIVGNGSIVRRMLVDTADIPDIQRNALSVREESKEKGQALCDQFRIPALYTDYTQFLANADIDTVYVGISNQMHSSYAKKPLLLSAARYRRPPSYRRACQLRQKSRTDKKRPEPPADPI